MKPRLWLVTGAFACAMLFSIVAHADWLSLFQDDEETQAEEKAVVLSWNDLIPADFVQPENPLMTMSQDEVDKLMDGSDESNAELAKLEKAFNYAPIVEELDGKRVRIPAYITPLEFNEQSSIKEFLLVPYVGACMHTPPPPANQIVYVQSPEAIKIRSMYEPVWAIGTIRTETVESELAESGYRLDLEKVMPYSQGPKEVN